MLYGYYIIWVFSIFPHFQRQKKKSETFVKIIIIKTMECRRILRREINVSVVWKRKISSYIWVYFVFTSLYTHIYSWAHKTFQVYVRSDTKKIIQWLNLDGPRKCLNYYRRICWPSIFIIVKAENEFIKQCGHLFFYTESFKISTHLDSISLHIILKYEVSNKYCTPK